MCSSRSLCQLKDDDVGMCASGAVTLPANSPLPCVCPLQLDESVPLGSLEKAVAYFKVCVRAVVFSWLGEHTSDGGPGGQCACGPRVE